MSLSSVFNKTKMVLDENSPAILTGLAITGVASTIVLAVRATPKATLLLAELDKSTEYTPTIVDKIKATWKCYVPTALSGTATILCIIGANRINTKRNAALALLYSMGEKTFGEYSAKVIETIGEKKEAAIRDDIAKDRLLKSNPPTEIIITGDSEVLFYDSLSGRYFKSDIEKVRQTVNVVNRELLTQDTLTLNELYSRLGLGPNNLGELMGWSVDRGLLEVRFSTQLTENEKPCIVLDYNIYPKYM